VGDVQPICDPAAVRARVSAFPSSLVDRFEFSDPLEILRAAGSSLEVDQHLEIHKSHL
jgi:hypothetical protein